MKYNIRGITLDKNSERCKSFIANNQHLNIEIFEGVKGSDLSKDFIISTKLITDELLSTNLVSLGSIGCAESHRRIWKDIVSSETSTLILEDDVFTHHDIATFINNNYLLLQKIDGLFFTINTDSILQSMSKEGLVKTQKFQPRNPNKKWINNALNSIYIKNISFEKFIKGFGTSAYFLTPDGAKNMLENVFPLNMIPVQIPLISNNILPISFDTSANKCYSKFKFYITTPFLAFTPNTNSDTENYKNKKK